MAIAQGLHQGRDLVFTYGPLGFLGFPVLITSATGIAAFAFALVTHVALVAIALRTALDRIAWPAAVLVAGVVGAAPVPVADVPVLVVMAGAIWVLRSDRLVQGAWLAALAGVVSAVELLVKLNDGIVCLVVAALAAWRIRPGGVRAELVFLTGFAGALLGLWRATDSAYADLPEWTRLSLHLIRSYDQGMQLQGSDAILAVGLLLFCVLVALAVIEGRRLGGARGAALGVALCVFALAFFKEGFVRDDRDHYVIYFGAVAVIVLLMARRTAMWNLAAPLLAAVAFGATGASGGFATALLLLLLTWTVLARLRPPRRVDAVLAVCTGLLLVAFASLSVHRFDAPLHAVKEVRVLASGKRRAAEIAAAKARVRWETAIPRPLVRELQGHTVDVEPWGATIAWAYGFAWRPEPLLESYAAYDETLDAFAAHGLAAHGASRILLQQDDAMDAQNPVWEAPRLVFTEICDYRQIATSTFYSVLARSGDRCGAPRLLSSVAAGRGDWVQVPAAPPGELVYATIRFPHTAADSVRTALLRAPTQWVDVSRAPGSPSGRVELVESSGPLVMRAPQLASLPTDVTRRSFVRFRLEDTSADVVFYAVRLRDGR
jgi:hypothetical protein